MPPFSFHSPLVNQSGHSPSPPSPIYSPVLSSHNPHILVYRTQQLGLEYELPFLVLLARLERLVVLPAHRLLALPAHDVPHDMPSRRHVAFGGFGLRDVDDGVEEVGFAVLAAEVLDV